MNKMASWTVIYTIFQVIFIFFSSCMSVSSEITFGKYCADGTHPQVLPSHGKASGGFLIMNATDKTDHSYEPGLNCSVPFGVEEGYQLLIIFSIISLRNSTMDNLIVVYDSDKSTSSLAGQQVCTNENCDGLKFESGKGYQNITLKFTSANITVPNDCTGFKAVYTVFDYADSKAGSCHDKHSFLCENHHCISNDLVCDGHNNCGDRSDETLCTVTVKDTIWGIVVITVGVVSLLIFVPLFCYLAVYGTRSIVKSVTLPNQPTPLYSAVNNGERTSLLTSSEVPLMSDYWNSSSSSGRRHSYSYNTAPDSDSEPSTSKVQRPLESLSDQTKVRQNSG